jgi:hypothetical protein
MMHIVRVLPPARTDTSHQVTIHNTNQMRRASAVDDAVVARIVSNPRTLMPKQSHQQRANQVHDDVRAAKHTSQTSKEKNPRCQLMDAKRLEVAKRTTLTHQRRNVRLPISFHQSAFNQSVQRILLLRELI